MLPRGMPKRKGKDVLDMTEVIMVRQEEDEEAAAEPLDEDDEDDGGESEGEDEESRTNRGRILIRSYIYWDTHTVTGSNYAK